MPREQFLKELEDVDACFITLSEKIDATCLEHAKHVKVIAIWQLVLTTLMLS